VTPLFALPGRDLEVRELEALAAALAAEPETWRPLVRHDAGQRGFERLHRDENVEVWVISWMTFHDTGFHDHGRSSGGVACVEGEVCEERMALGGAHVRRHVGAGEGFSFDASAIHRVHNDGRAPAVTIHCYSPPLDVLGSYVVDERGVLLRETITAEEELRPIDVAAA
jgi:mannose-6-phosphate isomerase-like protein (cupin superfamily)